MKQSPNVSSVANSKKPATLLIIGDCFTPFLFVTVTVVACVTHFVALPYAVRNDVHCCRGFLRFARNDGQRIVVQTTKKTAYP